MAWRKKLRDAHEEYVDGKHDPVLRAIPLFLAVPVVALLAVDLDRYKRNSAFHHIQNRRSLVLDAVALSFVGLTIVWYSVHFTTSRYVTMPRWLLAAMDCVLSLATTTLGEMVLSMRTSSTGCFAPLGQCGGSTMGIMQATGALLILMSIPLHALWSSACFKVYRKFRHRWKRTPGTDAVAADPEGLSFSNDFLPRACLTSMEAPPAGSDALSFSNEIK